MFIDGQNLFKGVNRRFRARLHPLLLGRALAGQVADPERRVAAWLDALRPAGAESPGERAERVQRLLVSLLAVGGVLLGAATAAALFRYDGTHPVNVVWVLAVFVGAQLALVAATALLALPDERGVEGSAALVAEVDALFGRPVAELSL